MDVKTTTPNLGLVKFSRGHPVRDVDIAANMDIIDSAIRQTATVIVAAHDSLHPDQADYVCDGIDDQVQIQAAIDALPSVGGNIVWMEGNYVFSDRVEVSSNTTLHIESGAIITIVDNYVPTATVINGRTIYTIITNDDHTSGNENIHIIGNGRITGTATQSQVVSWAGVWLHKCDHSSIEGITIDHICDFITADGGTNGTERFFAAFFTECTHCDMLRLHASYTGDDVLAIRRSSNNCTIRECDAHHPTFGHGIQVALGSVFGTAGTATENNTVINNSSHDTVHTAWTESGIALHGALNTHVVNNRIANTGTGILVLGDSNDNIIESNRIEDITLYGIYIYTHVSGTGTLSGTAIINNTIYLSQSNDIGIKLYAHHYHIRQVRIGGTRIIGTDQDFQYGIVVDAAAAKVVYQFQITGCSCVDIGEGLITLDPSAGGGTIKRFSVDNCRMEESGYGIACIGATVEKGTISNFVVKSTRVIADTGSDARGVRLNAATEIRVIGCEVEVKGLAFSETGACDYNTFIGNNGIDSGTPAVIVVGSNTTVSRNMGTASENSGTATLVNGTTSIAVTHGLDFTPVAGDIVVTPIEAWGNMTQFYIDTYTSTQFTIHADINPGQDVDFAWKAIVL